MQMDNTSVLPENGFRERWVVCTIRRNERVMAVIAYEYRARKDMIVDYLSWILPMHRGGAVCVIHVTPPL